MSVLFEPQESLELDRVLREVNAVGLNLTPDEAVAACQRILDVRIERIRGERLKLPVGDDGEGPIASRFTFEVLVQEYVTLCCLYSKLMNLSEEEKQMLANPQQRLGGQGLHR
jgi:hypothetical protein